MQERFNQQRMNKCLDVFQKIVNNWISTSSFRARVVSDEPVEGKSLDDIEKIYFDVGVGDDLTALPFMDMLIVFKMLAEHATGKTKRTKTDTGFTDQHVVKTQFSEDEAFAILNDIVTKVGIEIRAQPGDGR